MLKGFNYPFTPKGKSTLNPPPPWFYSATSVIDYIVQRLVDEGITHCFGVPGDYAFPVCDGDTE